MRKLGIVIGGAIALAACARTPPPPVDLNNPLLAPGFLAQASQNAGVRNFANTMISDHTRLSQAMGAAAAAARLQPPAPTLLPAQQAMLDQLRSAGTGYSFDQAYQQAQITAHQNALTLFQNYAASGDLPPLRTAAGQAVPTIQSHLAMAQALQIAPPPPPPPRLAPPPPVRRSGERG